MYLKNDKKRQEVDFLRLNSSHLNFKIKIATRKNVPKDVTIMSHSKEIKNENCTPNTRDEDLLYYKKLLSMLRLKNELNQRKKN